MKVREFDPSDIPHIDKIYVKERKHGVPSLRNIVSHRTIEHKDKGVVAYGSIKLFAEAYLLLDPELSNIEKTKIIDQTLKVGIEDSKNAGLEQLFLISNDLAYTNLLRKHYNFRVVPGQLLMLDLD